MELNPSAPGFNYHKHLGGFFDLSIHQDRMLHNIMVYDMVIINNYLIISTAGTLTWSLT